MLCVYTCLETIDAYFGRGRSKHEFRDLYASLNPDGKGKIGREAADRGVLLRHKDLLFTKAGFLYGKYLPKEYMLKKGARDLTANVFLPLSYYLARKSRLVIVES